MTRSKKISTTEVFAKSLAQPPQKGHYVLRLYVTGMTPRSTEAVAAIRAICEEHLRGKYDLQVIDIYQHPALAKDEQIIAVPTLVKKLPAPLSLLIGNLSDKERVLLGLNLRREPGPRPDSGKYSLQDGTRTRRVHS